jgi:hypothetical protein
MANKGSGEEEILPVLREGESGVGVLEEFRKQALASIAFVFGRRSMPALV